MDLDTSSLLFRDILCEYCLTGILLPFISKVTPSLINRILLYWFNGSTLFEIQQKGIEMRMSNELHMVNTPSDSFSIYMASSSLSRFQCENLLFRSPSGSFIIRNPHQYSDYIILSFNEDSTIHHRLFYKIDNGYEDNSERYVTLFSIIEKYKSRLFYGIRLDKNNQVIAIDTMPWFTNLRVRESKSICFISC